jgi:hypothetical protein
LSIFDYSGKVAATKNVLLTAGTTLIPYQLEQLRAGIYLVKIIDNNSNLLHASKVVK